MAESEHTDLDYEGGFLSETQREYLLEGTGKSLDNYSNPSQWWSRVRHRYEGALRDLALLGSYTGTDQDRVQELQKAAQQNLNKMGWMYKEESPLLGVHSATALAGTYDNGDLMKLLHPMSDVAQQVREERNYTQKFIVKSIIQVLQNGNPDDEEILSFLSQYWPNRDRVVEIAEQELSED